MVSWTHSSPFSRRKSFSFLHSRSFDSLSDNDFLHSPGKRQFYWTVLLHSNLGLAYQALVSLWYRSCFQREQLLQLQLHAWPSFRVNAYGIFSSSLNNKLEEFNVVIFQLWTFWSSMSASVSTMSRLRASGLSLALISFLETSWFFLSTCWDSRLYLLVQPLISFKTRDVWFTIIMSQLNSLKAVFMDIPLRSKIFEKVLKIASENDFILLFDGHF